MYNELPKAEHQPLDILEAAIERAEIIDPETLQALEKQLIAKERAKIAETGEEIVLGPSQKELMRKLIVRLKGRTGAGIFLVGPPGTGKTWFLNQLAQYLIASNPRIQGVLDATSIPLQTAADYVSQPSPTERRLTITNFKDHAEQIHQSRESNTQAQRQLIVEYLQHEFDAYLPPQKMPAINLQRKQAFIQEALQINNISLTETDLQDLSEDQIQTIFDKLYNHFCQAEQDEKSQNLHHRELGVMEIAARKGLVLIVNEVHLSVIPIGDGKFIAFGAGAESLLDANGQNLVVLQDGHQIERHEGFQVFLTSNENNLPDNILRRFSASMIFTNKPEDLIYQARVLLANEHGESILKSRPDDEDQLAKLLLWWQALGHNKRISFNVNVLAQLCAHLREGHTFDQAMNNILDQHPQMNSIYQAYLNQNGRDQISLLMPTQDTQLTLAELNRHINAQELIQTKQSGEKWEADKQTLEQLREAKQRKFNSPIMHAQIDSNYGTIDIQALCKLNSATGQVEGTHIASCSLRTEAGDWSNYNHLHASPLAQTAFLTENGRYLQAYDTTRATALPIITKNTDPESGELEDEAWSADECLTVQWFNESQGYMLTQTNQGQLQVVSFTKEFYDPGSSSHSWHSRIRIQKISKIPLPDDWDTSADNQINYETDKTAMLIKDQQSASIILVKYKPDNVVNPFTFQLARQDDELLPNGSQTLIYHNHNNQLEAA